MASLPTLAEIKAALGIDPADDTKDAAIERTLEAAIDIIETYCGRGFAYKAEVEEHDPITSRDRWLFLFRFPVEAVTSVRAEGSVYPVSSYAIYKKSGLLQWLQHYTFGASPCSPCSADKSITIEYTGGYKDDAWPAGLVDVIESFFYVKWRSRGSGDIASAAPSGAVKSSTVDGLAITYADALGSASAVLEQAVIPAGLEPWAAQLEPYRQRRAPGA